MWDKDPFEEENFQDNMLRATGLWGALLYPGAFTGVENASTPPGRTRVYYAAECATAPRSAGTGLNE